MNVNIVLMGCDNTGKTTLAKALAEYLNGEYIKSLGPGKTKNEQIKFMNENLEKSGVKVYDRFPLIEEVTSGMVLRKNSNFDLSKPLEKNILSKIDLFILCFPGMDKVKEWGEREQYEGVKTHVEELVDRFSYVALKLKNQGKVVLGYNYTKTSTDVACKVIKNNLKEKVK